MDFEIIEKIYDVEIIAIGSRIRILAYLQTEFGKGRWRKLKEPRISGWKMAMCDWQKFTGSKHME